MNKIIIPTILTAIVLISGIFAFIPVQQATTVHDEIIAAIQGSISGSQDAILEDLEDKIKLSSASFGPTAASVQNNDTSAIIITALDGTQETTFNLKECYLEATTNNNNDDDVQVIAILVDDEAIYTGVNQGFTSFGPFSGPTVGSVTATVEILSGLGFHTGLGAEEEIQILVEVDDGDLIKDVTCIAFVQNSADLKVTVTDPVGG